MDRTGTDQGDEPARSRGFRVHPAHPLRVRGGMVSRVGADGDHPLRLAHLLRDLTGAGVDPRPAIAVGGEPRRAGLAAAMVGWTLTHAGLDPTVVLDRFAPQVGGWGRTGAEGGPIVAQVGPSEVGAEFSVWLDAAGPGWRDQVMRAVAGDYLLGYARSEDPPGDPGQAEGVEVERFSLAEGREWWGADVREERGCSRFRTFHRGRFVAEIHLQIPGPGLVVAALAAVAVCARVDVPARGIKEALEDFTGVSRGFESRGSYRGVTLLDDEACTPPAVGEVLDLARRVHGRRRLCVAYRPGPAEASEAWPLGSVVAAFAPADRVWVLDEGGSTPGVQAEALAATLRDAGGRVERVACRDQAVHALDGMLEPGDVLVTLGAGDVGTIADAFLRRLSRNRHDGRAPGAPHLVPAGGDRQVSGSPA